MSKKIRLVVENLAIVRGEQRLLENVGFELSPGDCLLVTGPNGAGKSTLLRTIAGLHPFTEGAIYIAGAIDQTVGETCHYLGHKNGFKPTLTIKENLQFWQKFCGKPELSITEALDEVELLHTIDLPFGYLSAGQKRRVAIARLLLNDRPIWILDEPTAGLDQNSCEIFDALAAEFCDSGGILIAATHMPLSIPYPRHLKLMETGAVELL